jgi:hypothetical protein
MVDSMFADEGNKLSVPRPLADNSRVTYINPQIPVISSFGFGFGNKGFGRMV